MAFDSCQWMNHPAATYKAEHKAVQLATAKRVGFSVPRTAITNHASGISAAAQGDQTVAIKGLDTVLVRQDDVENIRLHVSFGNQGRRASPSVISPSGGSTSTDRKAGLASNRGRRQNILQFSDTQGKIHSRRLATGKRRRHV